MDRLLTNRQTALDMAGANCARAVQDRLRQKSEVSSVLMERFWGLDPQKPLQRGFCRLENSAGKILFSAGQVKCGDMVNICMQGGRIGAQVKEVSLESSGENR